MEAVFSFLHTHAVAVLITFFVTHWYLSLISQSFLYHRYAAHRAFTMSPTTEMVIYVITYIIQGSSYLSPRSYGILHRLHHQLTDTPYDPHSPSHYEKGFFNRWFGFIPMFWETAITYDAIDRGKRDFTINNKRYTIDDNLTKNLPYHPRFDRLGQSWGSKLGWGTFYTLIYLALAPSCWWLILVPIHWLMSPVHGVIINWYAHTIGYRNFAEDNTSTNLFPFDPMAGEGLHNNHHHFPSRANFAVKWYEFDLTYQVVRLLSWFGVITIRNTASAA